MGIDPEGVLIESDARQGRTLFDELLPQDSAPGLEFLRRHGEIALKIRRRSLFHEEKSGVLFTAKPMTLRNIALTRWLLAACLAAAPALAPAARSLSQDEAFLAARDAFRAGDAARITKHAARLEHYVLKPWVEYWLLKTRLEEAQPEEIREFLERNANSYLAETLRRDW